MKKKRKIPFRNRSPYGWWIASYIERPVWDAERKPKPSSRHLAWENTIILKAPDREKAYKKALSFAKKGSLKFKDPKSGRKGHWVMDGLTMLLPIHEELKDGAEILWAEYENISLGKVQKKVRSKKQLECFDDTLAIGDYPYGESPA